MYTKAKELVKAGIRTSTQKTYSSGEKKFLAFCEQYGLCSLPCSEQTLLLYVAFLDSQGLVVSSVRVYLAAIRSLHINEGYNNPLEDIPRLQKALRALEISSHGAKQKLPVTLDILIKLQTHMGKTMDDKCVWAAMLLAFFGCLRAGELTVGSGQTFDPQKHLTIGDVSVNQDLVTVFIKQSKTDKKNKGFHVVLQVVRSLD